VEERRGARVGTVSGLALLVGGTAIAAAAGGTHSVFATILLSMLAAGLAHALIDELRRQARRAAPGWARHDTVNAVLLASWAAGALSAAVLAVAPASVRAVGLGLALGYAVSCGYFVVTRRRTIAGIGATPVPTPATPADAVQDSPVGDASPDPIR
jgi:hypothetical protein